MQTPPRRRHWIPPAGLVAGHLAHGLSWALLFALAVGGSSSGALADLAWVHLVALGWLTMVALSVLVHVIPTFVDVPWRAERLARGSLAVYGAGVVALVVMFWNDATWALPWAGGLVALGLTGYLVPATLTLRGAYTRAKGEAPVARALSITFGSLAVAAALGVALAWALAGSGASALLARVPPVHASIAIVGWLTLLVMGVSTRTVRPITGGRSHAPWAHVAAGSSVFVGMLAFAVGTAFGVGFLAWFGALAAFAGAAIYVVDLADVLRRATVTHRPPQAFLAAGATWFVAAFVLSIGTLAGQPWGAAAVYAFLVGWIGQMVNGHLHHIGIRLIATMERGDDDETRPGELLAAPLSWAAFALFQVAVVAGLAALLLDLPRVLAEAACGGGLGWIGMTANVALARRRARSHLSARPGAGLTDDQART